LNSSQARRFEALYRQLWGALHRPDDDGDGLGQHERELLAHVGEGASLGWLVQHLLLPKSTASVLVKDLERRGFLVRRRDPDDERRLRITLTAQGDAAVAADHVLDLGALHRALQRLTAEDRRTLLDLLGRLAAAAAPPPRHQGPPRAAGVSGSTR
jgi:DNA-binding MarR family transcriptional regulator